MEKAQDKAPKQSENHGPQSFVMQTGEGVRSITFGQLEEPQGEVMKLNLLNAQPQENDEAPAPAGSQLFGTHIKEAIAIVKDWKNRP
jgi:hypothetical protein